VKIDLAIRELHRAENDLAHELLQVSERHAADHDVHHLARDLAVWSQRHVRELASAGTAYGLELDPEPEGDVGLVKQLREKGGELIGRRGEAGILLLRDLRELYMKASGVSVDWELLAQAAQGIADRALLAVVDRCHPETLRQARWANSMLKESATQILVS
jgi:hypothetical protein